MITTGYSLLVACDLDVISADRRVDDVTRTSSGRYFVLQNAKLYYFNAWEDYGSLGLSGATNYSYPIIVRSC